MLLFSYDNDPLSFNFYRSKDKFLKSIIERVLDHAIPTRSLLILIPVNQYDEGRRLMVVCKERVMIDFVIEEKAAIVPSIKVLGVGGAGGNTVNSLIDSGCQGIYCIAANTDSQALEQSRSHQKIQLGTKTTKGLGTGANPDIGKHAAEEDLDTIMKAVGNADIVFLTAGMGGGTGSGALPVIARALKKADVLTIALVTTPFMFEGRRRLAVANQALDLIRKEVDALIVLPNQRLLAVVEKNASLLDSFAMINDLLNQAIKSIADIVTKPGYINVDFADLKAIMKGMGLAVMGTGRAQGQDRAMLAAHQAISSPLLENITIDGARGILLNITGGAHVKLHEINEAATVIYESADPQAQIIVGAVIDEALDEEIVITVIATGFQNCASQSDAQFAQKSTEDKAEKISAAVVADAPAELYRIESALDKQVLEAPCVCHPAEPCQNQSDNVSSNDSQNLDDLDVPTFMRNQMEHKN